MNLDLFHGTLNFTSRFTQFKTSWGQGNYNKKLIFGCRKIKTGLLKIFKILVGKKIFFLLEMFNKNQKAKYTKHFFKCIITAACFYLQRFRLLTTACSVRN